jgi:hypothetical protein
MSCDWLDGCITFCMNKEEGEVWQIGLVAGVKQVFWGPAFGGQTKREEK